MLVVERRLIAILLERKGGRKGEVMLTLLALDLLFRFGNSSNPILRIPLPPIQPR